MPTRRALLAGLALPALRTPALAQAQPDLLRIAVATEWFALDPHFHTFPANLSMAHHVFDALTEIDPEGRLLPRLAEEWSPRGTEGWVFRLRGDAKFSDGTQVTAEDVKATLARVAAVQTPARLTIYTRTIASAEVIDARTIFLRTESPDPFLPRLLSAIYIIQKRFEQAPLAAFNSMEAAIGSGPFRYAGWQRGQGLTLQRNDLHWGQKPDWRQVDYRVITNTAAREAALLAGDVDFIQSPSTTSVDRLAGERGLQVARVPSARVTYVQMHQGPEPLADMKTANGKNPFADARVRRALSLSIPREAIRERIMGGLSQAAGQIVPPGYDGFNAALGIEPYDLAQAEALLKEAGWADGFEVTFTTPNDRNVNGVRVVQTIAAALRRLNIRAEVNAVPLTVQQTTWRQGKQSLFMQGAGPLVQPYLSVVSLTHTKQAARGLGTNNESFFSNAALDEVIGKSLVEIDTASRTALMERAAGLVREHTAIIPVHHEIIVHAARSTLKVFARADERIHASEILRA
jgi:peptide/nickel transport system substrate-binding protein